MKDFNIFIINTIDNMFIYFIFINNGNIPAIIIY